LHLFVLTGFAIAQPVYDRLGDRSAYLVDMRVEASAIVLLALLFSVIVPAIPALILKLTSRLFPRAVESVVAVLCFILFTMITGPLIKRMIFLPVIALLPNWAQVILILAAGAATTWAYFRFSRMRLVVSVASPAIIVFPAIFLLASPVARQFFFQHAEIRPAHGKPVSVVLVVLDELCSATLLNENQEIDGVRFPNFAKLANGSTWFRNATTVFPDTWQALPSILSGRYPETAWAPTVADLPQNLFSLVEATGAYELTAFEPVSRLAPHQRLQRTGTSPNALYQVASLLPTLQLVLLYHIAPAELHQYLPAIPKIWFGLHDVSVVDPQQRRGLIRYALGDDRRQQFDHFLSCLSDSEKPQIYFCHVLLPHIPWCYLPSGRKCLAETQAWELLSDDVLVDELYAEQSQQRHLLQVEYTDLLVGRLLDRLHETGLYDDCLLIVTADHGVAFKANDFRRAATDTNLADLLPVPLFVKMPGQRTRENNDRNVESVDILPTIASTLGIELQFPIDGTSVFATTPERDDKKYHTSQSLGMAMRTVPRNIVQQSTVSSDIRRRFGPATDPEALFRIGPHPELIGRACADVPRGEAPPTVLALRNTNSDYSTDPSAIVPCYVEGRVVSPNLGAEPVNLAIAVNGIVRATTRTYLADRFRDRFAAMLPESAFREGPNDVEYFVLTGSGDSIRRSPCTVRSY
jgi:hypothetical protein